MVLIDRGRVMLDYLENVGRKDSYKAKFEALCKAIDDAPTIDWTPVRNGYNKADYSMFECSECGWECGDTLCGDTEKYNFCPNCGAKMDGGKQKHEADAEG